MTKILFADFPDFKPNLTPRQMFEAGIMGGSYFRPIVSPFSKKSYKNRHKKYAKILKGIPSKYYKLDEYDNTINRYKVSVGTTYEYWMKKNWIREDIDPYGWIEWYCNFWSGRRSDDDNRQIQRWKNITGKNGRFRRQLQNKINEIGKNDDTVSVRIRQTLLHWAFDTRQMRPQKNNTSK
jgi:hypothetical protein